MRTAINSAARWQRMWGVVAARGRLGECVRIHGDLPEPRLEVERRTDFGQTLAAQGAGPARRRLRTRSRRAAQ